MANWSDVSDAISYITKLNDTSVVPCRMSSSFKSLLMKFAYICLFFCKSMKNFFCVKNRPQQPKPAPPPFPPLLKVYLIHDFVTCKF